MSMATEKAVLCKIVNAYSACLGLVSTQQRRARHCSRVPTSSDAQG